MRISGYTFIMEVGIVGGSGYGGTELLRLLVDHPDLEVAVVCAGSHAGGALATHTPSLAAAYPGVHYAPTEPERLAGLDVVFMAMPHGQSQHLVPDLVGSVGLVVDLAADFRLQDLASYEAWYGEAHHAPDLVASFTYGLVELGREALVGARAIAAPGCYPTAASLALWPFTRDGLVERSGIIIDASSGLSGAGRAPSDRLHFAHAHDDVVAYGLLNHRHTPEIEVNLGAEVLFTPHLVPMARGMEATCYARVSRSGPTTTDEALEILHAAYDDEPFVVVTDAPPSTKATLGSNLVHVTARVDPRTGWLVAMSTLDNLVKGAAGGAIQAANVALGLGETSGLPSTGLYP